MRRKDNAKAIPYLLPALVSILIVTCIPIIYTIVISFTNYNMYHLNDFTFIAFQNYLTVFSGSLKDVFFPVLGWTVCFAVLSTLGSYTMGLGLAILLNNPKMKESMVIFCRSDILRLMFRIACAWSIDWICRLTVTASFKSRRSAKSRSVSSGAKICKKETAPEWSPTRNVFPSFEKDSPDGEMKSLVERPVLGRSDHWK